MHIFLITHHHSGYEYLNKVLGSNPRIATFCTETVYEHPTDLLAMDDRFHHVFVHTLLHNHALANKAFYSDKFIYLTRKPEPTLSAMLAEKVYCPEAAADYYRFRLQRISQLMKLTPDKLVLSWDELADQSAFPRLETYLGLKTQLRGEQLIREIYYEVPDSLLKLVERAYSSVGI